MTPNRRTTNTTGTEQNNGRGVPHDDEAERQLLGTAALKPDAARLLAEQLNPEDFYLQAHKHVAAVITDLHRAGTPIDYVTISDELSRRGLLDQAGGQAEIVTLPLGAVSAAPEWVRIIKQAATRRRLIALAGDLTAAAYQNTDPAQALEQLRQLDTIDLAAPMEPGPTIDVFLQADEPEYDWIVPGLIERGDRILLTGNEGDGKSTLLRQMAIQMAAGLHPFALSETDPVRVIYIDLENSSRQVRRKLRPLRLAAPKLDADNLTVKVRPQGLDLLNRDDVAWFDTLAGVNEPDLVIVGPLYKMASGDPTEEQVAKTVSSVLDNLRTKHQFAVIIEAHTPHSVAGSTRRPERPYGASLWLRWPEFGLYLAKEGNLRPWRGARDERDWPVVLTRGGDWPWTVDHDDTAVTFARCLEEVRNAGRRLSIRELADLTGASKSRIQRMLENGKDQWDDTCASVEGERDLSDDALFSEWPGLSADELTERRRRKQENQDV